MKSLARLDGWIDQHLPRDPRARATRTTTISIPTIALYLYGRSSSWKTSRSRTQHREAVDYFLGQAKKYWLQLDRPPVARPSGPGAEAVRRQADRHRHHEVDQGAVGQSNEEMGMFWRDTGAVVLLVSRPDRNAGPDDRGLRRSDERRRRPSRTARSGCSSRSKRKTGRRPRPPPTPSTPCCSAATTCSSPMRWSKSSSATSTSSRRRSRPAPASTSRSSSAARSSRR